MPSGSWCGASNRWCKASRCFGTREPHIRLNIDRPCIEVRATRLGYEFERAKRIVVWGIESVVKGKPLVKTLANLLKSFFTCSAIRDKFR